MGKGSKERVVRQESSTQPTIPAFLQPHIERQAQIGNQTLEQLVNEANRPDLVVPLNVQEVDGIIKRINFANGAGGFLPTANETFLNIAGGRGLDETLEGSTVGALRGAAGGQELSEFVDPTALAALQQTAAGDFNFGGTGHQAVLEAAQREAQKRVFSAFGGDSGGGSNGLARAAIGREVGDAFAGLFNTERQRQLAAANALTGLSGDERARQLSAAAQLGQFSEAENQRQVAAAGFLPELGQVQADALQEAGRTVRTHDQLLRSGRSDALERLLLASQGVAPVSATIGSQTSGTQTQPLRRDGIGQGIGLLASVAGLFKSHSDFKEDIKTVEGGFLDKLSQLDIIDYRYKPEMGLGIDRHIGPRAEQFREVFGVGDGVTIQFQDLLGVLLGAVKELGERGGCSKCQS